MNAIPKKINIYGVKFKIKLTKMTEYSGLMDYKAKTIYISEIYNKTDKERVATLWHEIFHAIHYRIGLDQAISREMLEVLAESQACLIMELMY